MATLTSGRFGGILPSSLKNVLGSGNPPVGSAVEDNPITPDKVSGGEPVPAGTAQGWIAVSSCLGCDV